MTLLATDLAYVIRGLLRNPGVTLTIVLTLSVGIGANAAIFSVVRSLILRPLPFPDPDRLVSVQEDSPETQFFVTIGDYLDWKHNSQLFATLSAYTYRSFVLESTSGSSGDSDVLQAVATSSDFFRALGVEPMFGRTFLPAEDRPGAGQVVVLSHGVWTRVFGGDRGVLGLEILLERRPHTVIGVMPADFDFPVGGIDVWTPRVFSPEQRQDRRQRGTMVFGRLLPDVTLAQADTSLKALAAHLADTYPLTNTGRSAKVVELRHQQASTTAPFLVIGQMTAFLVLCIACANVSNLQLARVTARRRETMTRVALGGGRRQIARLLLIESLSLSIGGGLCGTALAGWGVGALKDAVSPDSARFILGFEDIAVDWTVLAFSLAIAAGAGVLCGLSAVWAAFRDAPMGDLRAARSGSSRHLWCRTLVAGEIAIAIVVAISAGQMVSGFRALVSADRGFSSERVTMFQTRLTGPRYEDPQQARAFYDDLLATVSAGRAVEHAALVSTLPAGIRPGPSVEFQIEGLQPRPGEVPLADLRTVSPDYFSAIDIPLRQGRTFNDLDDPRGSAASSVIINERLAAQYWPNGNPIDKRLRLSRPQGPWLRVVGVVGNVRQNWFTSENPRLYVPAVQSPGRSMYLVVRGSVQAGDAPPVMTQELLDVAPDVSVLAPRPLSAAVEESVAGIREAATLMGLFGLLAMFLAAVGAYGLMAYSVKQRQHEFGLRIALGATPYSIVWLVVQEALMLTAAGISLGIPTSALAGQFWRSVLFGAGGGSLAASLVVAALVTVTAIVACCPPALTAARVSPLQAIRREDT